jgi:GNAT superfamily N-acetyltransferase
MEGNPTVDETTGLPVRPLPDGSDIRKATPADHPGVVEAIAQGFYDDPIFMWMLPDDERRLEKNTRGLGLFLRRVWAGHDEIYTTDRLAGAACWMPPGTAHLSVFAQLALLPSMVRIFRGDFPRVNALLTAFDKKHPKDPHYYLPVIAVHPQWQGRGFGAALLRPMLERCDADGTPAYLEATSPRNRTLYERNGFEAVEEITVKDSPPVTLMWRDPQPGQSSSASTA